MQSALNTAEQHDVLAPFFVSVHQAQARLLMLDYDGTLAPFTADRAHATPYPGIPAMISRIMQFHTRVVLISGRAASALLFLCRIYPHPEIWGSHGAERLYPDGSYRLQQPTPDQRQGLEIAKRVLTEAGLAQHLESKPTSLAVHWRGMPRQDQARIESKVHAAYSAKIKHHGLDLFRFDGGLEIRNSAMNKGDAVKALLRESGKEVAAAYLGDDQTDEDAFHAIKGHGLAVLVRTEVRPTAADVWLRPPAELEEFFQEWLVACGATR